MKKYWVLLILCAVFQTAVFVFANTIRSSRPVISPYCVGSGSMSSYVEYGGKLEAGTVENVYTDISVFVESIKVKTGQKVKKGELLARLDNTRLRSAIYELDLEKYKSMDVSSILKGYLSGAGIDMFDLPSIDLEAELGIKKQPKELYSPMDGMILEINAKANDYTKTSRPVFAVADMSFMRVRALVPETAAASMYSGRKAQISGSAFRGKSFSAVVKSVSPVAVEIYEGTSLRTVVEVILEIPKPDSSLKPGYSANVKFYTSVKDEVLQVPHESISQDEENRTFVYVLEGGRAVKRIVETGLENENYAEITEGLFKGDYIAQSAVSVSYDGEVFSTK